MKKIIILLVLITLLVGCEATYNLNINSDLSIEEKLVVTEMNDINKANFTFEDLKTFAYKNYISGGLINEATRSITIKQKYPSWEEYKLSPILLKFGTIEATDNSLKIKFTNEEMVYYFFAQGDFITKDGYETEVNSSTGLIYTIAITIPFEVTSHNAVDIKGNTYIWKINEKNFQEDIEINFIKTNIVEKVTDYDSIFLYVGIALGVIVIYLIIKLQNKKRINNEI